MSTRLPRVGLSACFFHADPQRPIFKGKTLLYVEESMAHYVAQAGGLPLMIPTAAGAISLEAAVAEMDGLVLQGGSDVCPRSYGEEPLDPRWEGDHLRDLYEISLIRAFRAAGKPILGICRGLQVINVALGGTLFQDITTQLDGAREHRNWDVYDQLKHEIICEPGSWFAKIHGGDSFTVNSVHHQGIKDLAPDLVVQARSVSDGVVEAISLGPEPKDDDFLVGVQWHPEFQTPEDRDLLSREPILSRFMDAVRRRVEAAHVGS